MSARISRSEDHAAAQADVSGYSPTAVLTGLVGLLLIGLVLRVAVIWQNPARLSEDIDGYLALSESLRERGEYSFQPGQPTAFRPPLYPIAISLMGPIGRGLFNVGLATVTAMLAAGTGAIVVRQLGPAVQTRVAAVTLVFCAFSPLSVYYASYSMTEILCGFLLTSALFLLTRALTEEAPPSTESNPSNNIRTALLFAVSLGMACLTRPTSYAVGLLWFAWLFVLFLRPGCCGGQPGRSVGKQFLLVTAMTTAVVVSPWISRNAVALGKPIAMTTHGGYTLLLGNNDAFYDDVVVGPDSVWTDGQQKWVAALTAEMDERGIVGEVARDQWQKQRAYETIRRRPADFLRAATLRLSRFFNIAPETAALPQSIRWGVSTFYLAAWIFAIIGVWTSLQRRLLSLVPVLLLPLGFAAVHLAYWSNTRMRLPAEPAIFVFSAIGVETIWRLASRRSTAETSR